MTEPEFKGASKLPRSGVGEIQPVIFPLSGTVPNGGRGFVILCTCTIVPCGQDSLFSIPVSFFENMKKAEVIV
jgi:hypothetical protein